jgi:hypothetical protein
MSAGNYTEPNECNVESLDVHQVMLTLGMHASRYLLLYKDAAKTININDAIHMHFLNDLYDDVHHMYNEYNRDLENDITDFDLKYESDMKTFMSILYNLYYKKIIKSNLEILIELSNIHDKYYNQPIITLSENKIKVKSNVSTNISTKPNVSTKANNRNRRNTLKKPNTQQLANKMVQNQQNLLNFYKIKQIRNTLKRKPNNINRLTKKHSIVGQSIEPQLVY